MFTVERRDLQAVDDPRVPVVTSRQARVRWPGGGARAMEVSCDLRVDGARPLEALASRRAQAGCETCAGWLSRRGAC